MRNSVSARATRLFSHMLLFALIEGSAFAQSMQIPGPSKGLMPNPALGEKLFASSCAKCHDADLKGTRQGPPLLHRFYEPSHHGDAAFQLAVRNGSRQHHLNFGNMPPIPALSPDEVAHITAFVRNEQRKAGIR